MWYNVNCLDKQNTGAFCLPNAAIFAHLCNARKAPLVSGICPGCLSRQRQHTSKGRFIMKQTGMCEICGKKFTRNKKPGYPTRFRFCSTACYDQSRKTGETKKCEYCGKEVYVKKNAIKSFRFCSRACMNQSRSKKVKMVCMHCGITFMRRAVQTDQKYCSHKCQYAHMDAIKYKYNCEYCHKDYESYESSSRFCSNECKHLGLTSTIICPVCNKKVTIKVSHAKKRIYCSVACMKIAYKEIYMRGSYIKVDQNQGEIVDALISAGASVDSLAGVKFGVPDLLVGFRGINYLIEVKADSRRGKLTPAQIEWHAKWRGAVSVAHNIDEALEIIGAK